MSLKSYFTEPAIDTPNSFPKLVRVKECGTIVLFHDSHDGFVVYTCSDSYYLGEELCFDYSCDHPDFETLPSGSQIVITQG